MSAPPLPRTYKTTTRPREAEDRHHALDESSTNRSSSEQRHRDVKPWFCDAQTAVWTNDILSCAPTSRASPCSVRDEVRPRTSSAGLFRLTSYSHEQRRSHWRSGEWRPSQRESPLP